MIMHPADLKLSPEDEFALVTPLDDPEVVETMNIWIQDSERNICINFHPKIRAGEMECALTVFLPDGRILHADHGNPATFTDPACPTSRYVTLECLEPFKRWRASVDEAPVYVTSDAEQAGPMPDKEPSTTFSFHGELTLVSPPWINGALLPECRQTVTGLQGFWLANRKSSGFSPETFRYDQLLEGKGVITFEGKDYPIHGAGTKGHVRGVRRLPGMNGHLWAEGYSYDRKRGFGINSFPREGGGFSYSEGFVLENGIMHPSRIIYMPARTRDPANINYVFELACDAVGLVRILVEETRRFWWRSGGWGANAGGYGDRNVIRYGFDPAAPYVFRQGVARFVWEDGGDVGDGFVERSEHL
ncbi:MAG TPA: hypothetical protein VFP14_03685 [Novosphingobium sp.]|nr:hypothetical protein [Novosphingobium sp.]